MYDYRPQRVKSMEVLVLKIVFISSSFPNFLDLQNAYDSSTMRAAMSQLLRRRRSSSQAAPPQPSLLRRPIPAEWRGLAVW